MRIAFCSSEVVPFSKTGGLADVSGTLPLALEKLGEEVYIFTPLYRSVEKEHFKLESVGKHLVTTTIGKNIKVFFIQSDLFFDRDGLYGNDNGDYPDNLERFQFHSLKILEAASELNLKVDVFHCHDWQMALIPVYLKFKYKKDADLKKARSMLTIHNLAYQGLFPRGQFPQLGLPETVFSLEGLEFYGKVNLLKGGIVFSDMVTTVSPQYAKEIQGKKLGCGLDGVLKHKKEPVLGILNGLDYDFWNSETDKFIKENYSSQNINGKFVNKQELQKISKLPINKDIPIFGFVGRLTSQKGLDLIDRAMNELMKLDIQMVFMGIGEKKYSEMLQRFTSRYPKKNAAHLSFDERTAHQVYAGSDIFLMPSEYEPCGLSQMISLQYGTIPLVYKTGGLVDTITPFNEHKSSGNGFMFSEYTEKVLVETVKLSLKVYSNKEKFLSLIQRAFTCRFSWEHSAQEYQKAYKRCLSLA